MKKALFPALLLLASTAAALGQILPEDPAVARARVEAQVNQQLQQTQLNNLQVQQSLQANEIRQQQLFNSLPPAWQQQPVFVPAPKP